MRIYLWWDNNNIDYTLYCLIYYNIHSCDFCDFMLLEGKSIKGEWRDGTTYHGRKGNSGKAENRAPKTETFLEGRLHVVFLLFFQHVFSRLQKFEKQRPDFCFSVILFSMGFPHIKSPYRILIL